MKDYKWGKFLIFIALCGLGGAVIGGLMKVLAGNTMAVPILWNQFTPMLYWVALIFGIVGLGGYLYYGALLKKDGYSNEEGSCYEKNENKIGVVTSFSTLCAVINMTAFGLTLTNSLPGYYLLMFAVNVALAFAGEVSNISLVKKVRPELNADPTAVGFRKEYFDKLDEREKERLGRVSFKTMGFMVPAYVSVFALCWILILTFEVSPLVCLPVGILWLIQTVVMVYHSCKK